MSRQTQAQIETGQRREATCDAFGHQDVVRAALARTPDRPRQIGVVEETVTVTGSYCRYCQDWVEP